MNQPIIYQDLYHLNQDQILNEANNLSNIIREKEFNEISDSMLGVYFRHSQDDSLESLTINGMSKYFFELIHFCFLKQSYVARGLETPGYIHFEDKFFKNSRKVPALNIKKKLYLFLRLVYRNRSLLLKPKLWLKKKFFCVEFPFSFGIEFAKRKDASIIYLEKELFFDKLVEEYPKDHCNLVFLDVLSSFEKLNIKINPEEEKNLKSLWCEFYQYTYSFLKSSKKWARVLGVKEFISQSIGNIEARIVALSVRANQGNLYGFGHAHDIGMAITVADNVTAQIINPLSVFVTTSPLMKTLVTNLAKTVPNLEKRIETCVYDREVAKFTPKDPRNKKIEKVFIYEHGLIERRFKGECLHWPFQINLIEQLSKTFMKNKKSRDYSVSLKGHPDHLDLTLKVYDNFFDQIVKTRFEDVVEEADLLIFPHIISTTSLVPALTSSCYIILFDQVFSHCWPEVIPHLKERCMIVSSWRNEDDSVHYDENELLSLIENPKEFKPWTIF